jgi:hypothetical protein
MNQEPEDQLSQEERQAFANLPREKVPPSLLEERVVQSLKQFRLLTPARHFWLRHSRVASVALAASLLFFVLGAIAMKWFSGPAPRSTTPEFMLVLNENPAQRGISRETELQVAKEYGNWARQLSQQGLFVDGNKLKNDVPVVKIINGHPVAMENTSGEKIAGFFLISAANYQQAIKIAETCPHAKYGGTIEVREIDRF